MQDPTKHIHWPGIADDVWILRLWSLMYALEVVLYLHSAESDNIFQLLQARFDLSLPLKVHVILHHYMDFFETSGETLLSYSDEITEAMHSQIRLFEYAHRYINNKKGSSSHARMQHRSTVHINSINLG